MITFILSIILLFLGYYFYGRFVERVFGVKAEKQTPAYSINDGVDYVPMGWGKIFLIQFLNIAGLGPIFGAILGAVYGPVAFLWIVLGNIIGGAVHDYFSGMLSVRNNGLSISEITGNYLGNGIREFMMVFTVFLMVLVGAVFVMGPAGILSQYTTDIASFLDKTFWVWVIIGYYIIATLLPINKIIGKIYPLFGFALLFMAVGIFISIISNNLAIPELTFENLRNFRSDAESYPIFPMMFITIACGAISGFHSTQSPLMARCLKNEKNGRKVFYGAMVVEGVVALIWAAAGMGFYGGVSELQETLAGVNNNAAPIVKDISVSMLGQIGGVLAILGVVCAPITSGDTALRSGRLIIADFFKINQKNIVYRLSVTIPLFIIVIVLSQVKFDIIWRYMAWSNQTLATIVLWAISVYLRRSGKLYFITLIPAIFMTVVTSSYIIVAKEGFGLSYNYGIITGIVTTTIVTTIYFLAKRNVKQ